MKELSIEEKAKRFDEAIESLKGMIPSWERLSYNGKTFLQDLVHIFPELKESKDERIRKELLNAFQESEDSIYIVLTPHKRESFIAWLEKQGEQKPVVIIPNFRVGDNIKTTNEEPLTITKIDEKGYWSEDLFICSFGDAAKWELVEQTPAELIKEYDFHGVIFVPKFKKGDLIREKNSGRILTIKDFSYDNGLYTYDTGQFPITIQDNYEIIEQKPADEVGNYDHKEVLQTIINEQKPAWSEEDDKMYNSLTEFEKAVKQVMEEAIECGDTHNLKADADMLLRLTQKPWSRKDEQILSGIIGYLCTHDSCELEGFDEWYDWLKSLKDKVLPQTKKKWSEEEQQIIEDAACIILDCVNTAETEKEEKRLEELADKLQDLKPQSTWKPSDEQMKTLEESIMFLGTSCVSISQFALKSLYQNLKKLREEDV